MCGIVGLYNVNNGKSYIDKMITSLSHRGPDSKGVWYDESVVLGHARLSIIDLSETGRQPISDKNKKILSVCNGEIYNYLELKNDLISRGYNFRGTSDVEIIPNLYKEFGEKCFELMRGMFAIVIWDTINKKMIFARDRLGKKPLYILKIDNKTFAFASEIKAFNEIQGIKLQIRDRSIPEYLFFGAVPGKKTSYKNVIKVPPSTYMIYENESFHETRYWELSKIKKRDLTLGEAYDEFNELLDESIKIRLRSDVAVGCFLSGGIDSGLILSKAVALSNNEIHSFTVSFDNENFDEAPAAKKMAERMGTIHHQINIGIELKNDIIPILEMIDEPFCDASILPTYLISKFASSKLKVVLSGDGGDEIFFGYRHFLAAYLIDLFYSSDFPLARYVASSFLQSMPFPSSGRSKYYFFYRLLRALNEKSTLERYLVLTGDYLNAKEIKKLYKSDFNFSFKSFEEEFSETTILNYVYEKDFEFLLPCIHLVKTDLASMFNGLEVRSPLLDHKIVEFARSLRNNLVFSKLQTKPFLRGFSKRFLPKSIYNAPKKGFEIPLYDWMSGDLKPLFLERIYDPNSFSNKIFKKNILEEIINQDYVDPKRWSNICWSLFCLEVWWHKQNRLDLS